MEEVEEVEGAEKEAEEGDGRLTYPTTLSGL